MLANQSTLLEKFALLRPRQKLYKHEARQSTSYFPKRSAARICALFTLTAVPATPILLIVDVYELF